MVKKEENFKVKITFKMKSLFSQVIDFFLKHAYLKFVYKLDISNHRTVSNEKDMNKLLN